MAIFELLYFLKLAKNVLCVFGHENYKSKAGHMATAGYKVLYKNSGEPSA